MNDIYDYSTNFKGAWLTVNRHCNFRCKWCYAKDTNYDKDCEMSFETAKRLALIIKELGISNIMLIGGEPTLWTHLQHFNIFTKQIGLSTTIITNAFSFADDKYWSSYKLAPADYVVISIKGITSKQLYNVTGVSDIKKAKKGMERAAMFHKVAGAETVCSVLTKKEELISTANYAKSIGADTFLVSMCNVFFENGMATDKYTVNLQANMSAILDSYPALDKIYNNKLEIHTTLPYCVWPRNFINMLITKHQLSPACNVHNRSGIVFDYNGDVLFCNGLFDTIVAKWGEHFINSQTLISYLNSPQKKQEYSEILRFPSAYCTDCSKNASCRGGCIANWLVLDPEICTPI